MTWKLLKLEKKLTEHNHDIFHDYILQWKSKGLSDESIKSPSAPHNFPNLSLNYLDTKIRVRFRGSKITYFHGKIVNIYIVYEMNKTTENCLFDEAN